MYLPWGVVFGSLGSRLAIREPLVVSDIMSDEHAGL